MTSGSARIEIVRKAACAVGDAAIRGVARAALKAGGRRTSVRVTVVLTGDAEVRKLNAKWRGKDKTTDVLSFGNDGAWPATEDLGDVVISVPYVRRQAAERKIPFRRELALMVAHGCLHLLGYDHAEPHEEKRMFGLQDRLLRKLKYV